MEEDKDFSYLHEKFIQSLDEIEIENNGYVCISGEYDVVVELDKQQAENLDPYKELILLIARNFPELDSASRKYAEENWTIDFNAEIGVIYIESPERIYFNYWTFCSCNQFDAIFSFKDGKFFLEELGCTENINLEVEEFLKTGR